MAIKDWPEQERPREKLLKYSARHLSDAELLALFLRMGVKGKSAIDIARQMLKEHDSLRTILNLSAEEFCRQQGVGKAKYAELQGSLELGRRYLLEQSKKGQAITSAQATKEYLKLMLRDKPYEVFFAIFMDSKHRVIHHEELFRGTIDNASVPVREVVKEALRHNAAAMIVAHNHPSGVTEPSMADDKLTQTISLALAMVGVKLLDHMIVGEGDVQSYAEMGKLM